MGVNDDEWMAQGAIRDPASLNVTSYLSVQKMPNMSKGSKLLRITLLKHKSHEIYGIPRRLNLPSKEALGERSKFSFSVFDQISLLAHHFIQFLTLLRDHYPGVLLHAQF